MAELSDEQLARANDEGRRVVATEPHAKSARYDRKTGKIWIELYNGCSFAFPPRQLQGFEHATDDQIAEVEVIGSGYGLHWESLDADFTVPGLLAGRFGTNPYMAVQQERLLTLLDASVHNERNEAA